MKTKLIISFPKQFENACEENSIKFIVIEKFLSSTYYEIEFKNNSELFFLGCFYQLNQMFTI